MQRFRGIDFLDLESELSDEERMVRDAVRSFVDERILPIIGKCFDEGRFPTELIPEMAAVGLFGPTIPEKYGGQSLGPVAYGLMCRELERGDSGVRSMASVQGALVMYPILEYGSEEQKTRWLPKLAKGEAIGCFGLTEPDAGSNPGGMLSRARKDGNHWVLSGRKMWITNGTISDVSIVWAKDEAGVVRGFLVEKGTKGFSAPETKLKWSLRASVTSELVLDEVRIPEASRLPKAEGLKAPLSCLTQARYGIAFGGVGAAMACLEEAIGYSKTRIVFDKPLAAYQIPQSKLADMASDLTLGQLLALRVGRLKEQGRLTHYQVSLAKRNNIAMALKIARTCRDILGANGILLDYQSGRHLCNLETVYTYEGTHDIHTLAVGEALTGIPAYR
jgi:glutaryl-CoA dehydrogenase